jgi:tetratricopeptide (TPR) repeat protein
VAKFKTKDVALMAGGALTLALTTFGIGLILYSTFSHKKTAKKTEDKEVVDSEKKTEKSDAEKSPSDLKAEAAALYEKGRYGEALRKVTIALQSSPGDAEMMVLRAASAAKEETWDERTRYRRALEMIADPAKSYGSQESSAWARQWAWLSKGFFHTQLGQQTEAKVAYQSCREAFSDRRTGRMKFVPGPWLVERMFAAAELLKGLAEKDLSMQRNRTARAYLDEARRIAQELLGENPDEIIREKARGIVGSVNELGAELYRVDLRPDAPAEIIDPSEEDAFYFSDADYFEEGRRNARMIVEPENVSSARWAALRDSLLRGDFESGKTISADIVDPRTVKPDLEYARKLLRTGALHGAAADAFRQKVPTADMPIKKKSGAE